MNEEKYVEITITESTYGVTSSKTFKMGSDLLLGMPIRATSRANKFVTKCLKQTVEYWESLHGEGADTE